MHVIIPFASVASEASPQAPGPLPLPALPHLTRLLARMAPTERLGSDEYTLSPPHERAQAQAWQWQGADGGLPWAAQAAAQDGVAVGKQAWGLLTPVHWHVATDHVSLADPALLHLSAQASQTYFEAIRPLFEELGWVLAWGAPLRWYAAHESLQGLPSASLDRAVGRNIDVWLGDHPQAQAIRRLQNEVQMLLYRHPLNDERTEQGLLPVNSFWLSGCGPAQPVVPEAGLTVDLRLRESALRQDLAAWAQAWQTLDDSLLREALARAQTGEPLSLTLCGERFAQRFELRPRSLWQQLTRQLTQPLTQACMQRMGRSRVQALLQSL
jgi:hypothetical protein